MIINRAVLVFEIDNAISYIPTADHLYIFMVCSHKDAILVATGVGRPFSRSGPLAKRQGNHARSPERILDAKRRGVFRFPMFVVHIHV
jgi:hypothetical protein